MYPKNTNTKYKVATRESSRSATRYKKRYDQRVRGANIQVGDRVLVRNVGLRGKHKLANRWEEKVYQVVSQPNKEIPVFDVRQEGAGRRTRTLHRNLLFPVNFLPLPETTVHRSSRKDPQGRVTKTSGVQPDAAPPEAEIDLDLSGTDEDDEDRWIQTPRSGLQPTAAEFIPNGLVKNRREAVNEAGLGGTNDELEPVPLEGELQLDTVEGDSIGEVQDIESIHPVDIEYAEQDSPIAAPLPSPHHSPYRPHRSPSPDKAVPSEQEREPEVDLPPTLRRSTRPKAKPAWQRMGEYQMNQTHMLGCMQYLEAIIGHMACGNAPVCT